MPLRAYFNPRSREGSDPALVILDTAHTISIHAPAKGATVAALHFTRLRRRISIHAPAKGATVDQAQTIVLIDISIHAPAKGATDEKTGELVQGTFQSTLPRRERLRHGGRGLRRTHFNPRSREGSDLRRRCKSCPDTHFNPRSREGSDFAATASDYQFRIFQSTLPRRERREHLRCPAYPAIISIHAPAKGATLARLRGLRLRLISIHAPAKGATSLL